MSRAKSQRRKDVSRELSSERARSRSSVINPRMAAWSTLGYSSGQSSSLPSPHFCNSKRYPALLEYIVEKTLACEADLLKERTLGVEVFDRSPSYDTNADTVGRYTAGEVRKRLSLYYSELGHRPRVRMSLPAGSYVPEFLHDHDLHDHMGEVHGHPAHIPNSGLFAEGDDPGQEPGQTSLATLAESTAFPAYRAGERHNLTLAQNQVRSRRRWRLALAATLVIAAIAGAGWRYRAVHPLTPLDSFWTPVLHD